jgi:hypothetical protein
LFPGDVGPGQRTIRSVNATNTKRAAIDTSIPNTPMIAKKKTIPKNVAVIAPIALPAELFFTSIFTSVRANIAKKQS